MNPINQIYSDDFHRFVLQDQPIVINPAAENPKKKFEMEQSDKKKKVKDKEPSPWLPKRPKKDQEDEVEP